MTNKSVIQTDNAPEAIGTYSQAVKAGDTVYLSGQIPLDPETMEVVSGDISVSIRRVFDNLAAVCEASGGQLQDIVKLNLYLVDLEQFAIVNRIMEEYFSAPFPARAAVGVKSLPKGSQVEAEAVMILGD